MKMKTVFKFVSAWGRGLLNAASTAPKFSTTPHDDTMKSSRLLFCGLSVSLALGACSDDDSGDTTVTAPTELTTAAIVNYGDIVRQSYQDARDAAAALDTALEAFVVNPSDATLTDAKNAWLAAREPYLVTEVYRFYDGPIDDADGPEGELNAWPLDEAYIDYVEGDETAGIVNDTSVTIDQDTLLSLNGQGGDANVATGYHAIEFLLWGQDFDANGPGARPVTDYTTRENADRRGEYLLLVSDILVAQLDGLIAEWDKSQAGTYGAEWDALSAEDGLARALTGMVVLSGFETGGERLQVALDSGDQEDEHSCFSDNTHRDMIQDIQGIQNVWLGTYNGVDGTGFDEVIATADADLAASITQQISTSLGLAEALQPPFDQEIALDNVEGNARVEALVLSLQEQESLMEEAFVLFGLDVPVVE